MVIVAELRKGDWLEKELARQLGPVSAPESLWRRIHEQRRPLRVPPVRWAVWSAAAFALLALSAGVVAMTRDSTADLDKLAARELQSLSEGSGQVDFRSADPGEIQAWVKAKSDMNVPLPECAGRGNGPVRLLGARLIRLEGLWAAAITYRVGEDFAAMLVTGRRAGFMRTGRPGHGSLQMKTIGETELFSWNRGPEVYRIAFAATKDPQRACLLCHVNGSGLGSGLVTLN
jgi:hypothetical protein